MSHTDTSKEIADLNLTYMLLAQKLLREDKAAGMVRLGIGSELADLFAGMSLADTIRIASTNFMLCAFRLNEIPLVKDVMRGGREPALQQAHLSILLAGARPQQAARAA